MANYIFNIALVIYFVSYALPFANNISMWEIEIQMGQRLFDQVPPHRDIALLWSFHWLSNMMVLTLWWLKHPSVRRWVIHLTNKPLLDKALFFLIVFFVGYPIAFEYFSWQIGSYIWALSALGAGLSYQFLHTPPPQEPSKVNLEQHLIDFDREESLD